MSTQIIEIPPIPRETARTAYAIFNRNNFYILIGEQLETLLEGIKLKLISGTEDRLFPLITIFQAWESLTDAQASDALRTRIDWKFALRLPVNFQGVIESSLCEFRQRVKDDPLGRHHFYKLIDRLFAFALPASHGFQSCQSFELLPIVCSVNQSGLALDVMRQALEALAIRFPDWLRKIAKPHWYGRYNHKATEFVPVNYRGWEELSTSEICTDINHLLEEIHRSGSPEISNLPEIEALGLVGWDQIDLRRQGHSDNQEISNSYDCDSCPFYRRKQA